MKNKELLELAINAAIDGGEEIMKVYNDEFEVNIHINRIDDPITEKYPPTTFSLKYFINVLADSLAAISPALKNTITSPPKNKGAIKSFVSHKEDQSIMIPIVAKLNINNIPKIKTCFFGN